MSETAKRLKELGIVLPKPAAPVANYVPAVRAGALLFVSGQIPFGADGKLADRHKGKLNLESPIDAAREAARLCVINVLAHAQAALGDLDRVGQVVRLGGFFNVETTFDALPQAMNGASDLVAELFGAQGRHARTTVGVSHLPLNALAEVEAVFRDQGLRPVNAPAWLMERPIAHRGLHEAKGAIENTLGAAQAAIAAGFAIECDVQVSSDGEAIVFHDQTLDRLTGATGPLSARSAAELAKVRIEGGGGPPPTFAAFLEAIAGRTPVICELKSRFDGDWRIGDRVAALAAAYDGPLALKSFDHDLVGYLRLRRPRTRPGELCPIGIVAEASYADPISAFLTAEQKQDWTDFDHFDRLRPDFLSWNVDDLPHKIPFLMKELHGAPVMAWTVRTGPQREAALKWADQIVFEGDRTPRGSPP